MDGAGIDASDRSVLVAIDVRPVDPDLLTSWVSWEPPSTRSRRRKPDPVGGLRFAFYGRVSTAEFQEPASSRQWQRDVAEDLIDGHGRVVVEFFDIDSSRRLSWRHRPQAAALLRSLADPDRGFDAVVVGEYERAGDGSSRPGRTGGRRTAASMDIPAGNLANEGGRRTSTSAKTRSS
jgi:hypothetical protein